MTTKYNKKYTLSRSFKTVQTIVHSSIKMNIQMKWKQVTCS